MGRLIPIAVGALLAAACSEDKKAPFDVRYPPDGAADATLPTSPDGSVAYTESREACTDHNPLRNAYFGDLHIHTRYSFDAYVWGTRADPAAAYRFARGEPIEIPPLDADGNPTQTVQLERPLDFAAVTDHSEFLGELFSCQTDGQPGYDSDFCASLRENQQDALIALGAELTKPAPERVGGVCEGASCDARIRSTWQRIQEATEAAYDRSSTCRFTALHGYEWTANTGGSNLHRNVIFRNDTVPDQPVSYYDAPTPPELWDGLDRACSEAGAACDVLAIPHNSNLSNGAMFAPVYPGAETLDAQRQQARTRARLEPLVEIFQHKGTSECTPSISGVFGPPDELCAIEELRSPVADDCFDSIGQGGIVNQGCVSRYDFVRNALLAGLSEGERLGVNPYPLGFIGSTDTHSATAGATEEGRFTGHLGRVDATRDGRLGPGFAQPSGYIANPGGLAGAWAVENSRDALFDAFERRETFGTSGGRIAPRLFAGWGYSEDLCDDPHLLERAYAGGVPMGGTLSKESMSGDGAPRLVALAARDPSPEAGPLERLQIIKGWVDDSQELHYDVIDVAEAGGSSSVDEATCKRQGSGAATLCAAWTDPDFDPSRPAYYYLRAVETPSCRWSVRQCLEVPEADRPESCARTDLPRIIHEMAWTSPIWYAPGP